MVMRESHRAPCIQGRVLGAEKGVHATGGGIRRVARGVINVEKAEAVVEEEQRSCFVLTEGAKQIVNCLHGVGCGAGARGGNATKNLVSGERRSRCGENGVSTTAEGVRRLEHIRPELDCGGCIIWVVRR